MLVRRGITAALSIAGMATRLAAQDQAAPRIAASTLIVGAKETVAMSVKYSRTVAITSGVLGTVVPFDKPWITGLGTVTELSCPRPFIVGGLGVPAGTYALWTLPTRTGVTLILSRRLGVGPRDYDRADDVGRVPMLADTLSQPIDSLTIYFRTDRKAPDTLTMQYDVRQSAAMHNDHFTMDTRTGNVQNLVIAWDRFSWSLPVRLQEEKPGKP